MLVPSPYPARSREAGFPWQSLTKQQSAKHVKACALLQKEVLSFDDRLFVLEHWQEGANHINGAAGAFFTPQSLARDFALEVSGNTILDLCAGIGSLSFAAYHYGAQMGSVPPSITCVEINQDYIEVGKKILPEATWIQADALALPADLAGFDCAIATHRSERSVKRLIRQGIPAATSSTRSSILLRTELNTECS